ncbi:MAG: 16S rRNA (cytosine(1402)-N(4))-methyltransferase RsmH [Muribaculaceae bacterium]|nr:16S rRNA (cytosine(1402)-N(4))-methyltransferase RsmH [Muribaculaceae bacterium]
MEVSSEPVYHIPALLPQALEGLDIQPGGIYVDATYGGGGHSRAIVERLSDDAGGHLYGFDQDEDAVAGAITDPRFTMVYGNFRFLHNFLRYYGVDYVDGILADLGVSFHHFDTAERGFSFRYDGPLDMRMNRKATHTAEWLLANESQQRLADIFRLYGEMPQSRQIAAAIVSAREEGRAPRTIGELMALTEQFIPAKARKKYLAMLFQALRIAVNGELDALTAFLQQALQSLRPGGRLAVITYHSLEDRIVKNFLRTGNVEGERKADFFGRVDTPFELLTRRPIVPDEAEIEANPRSRSAKLRVAVKSAGLQNS